MVIRAQHGLSPVYHNPFVLRSGCVFGPRVYFAVLLSSLSSRGPVVGEARGSSGRRPIEAAAAMAHKIPLEVAHTLVEIAEVARYAIEHRRGHGPAHDGVSPPAVDGEEAERLRAENVILRARLADDLSILRELQGEPCVSQECPADVSLLQLPVALLCFQIRSINLNPLRIDMIIDDVLLDTIKTRASEIWQELRCMNLSGHRFFNNNHSNPCHLRGCNRTY